jgi:hypothetical protein
MREFHRDYIGDSDPLRILDVGGLDVNGTYRPLFKGHDYTAMDIEVGPGVDVVGWPDTMRLDRFDVVISGQAAEHAENFIDMMKSIGYMTKPGGLVCIIVPSRQQVEHRRPDYWRFTQEGAAKLMEFTGAFLLRVVEDGRDVMAVGRMGV